MNESINLRIFEGHRVKKYSINSPGHLDDTKIVDIIEGAKSTDLNVCELILSKIPISYSLAKIWIVIDTKRKKISGEVVYAKDDRLKILEITKPIHSFDEYCISNGAAEGLRFTNFKPKKFMSLPAQILKKKIGESSGPKICSLYIPLDMEAGKEGILSLYRPEPFTMDDYMCVLSYKGIMEVALSTFRRKNISGGLVKRSKETTDIKDSFLATISHELRTPLNGIVGMISMLKDAGPLTPKQEKYLTILMECSHQLMNMMNNLLDFNKMMSNRLTLVQGPVDIVKCVNDSISMVSGKMKSKGLGIVTKLNESKFQPPKYLIADRTRLIQILTNLLTNAIKFTEKGTITVKMNSQLQTELEGTPFKKWKISFEIEDTGIGVPDADKEKIFDLFHQSPSLPKELASAGTGLGLTITKELVRLMGGTIGVKDGSGVNSAKGSIFFFHILCNEEIDLETLKNGSALNEIRNAKIMVVDDRLEYRMQIVDILLRWGCQPTVASSGEEALQYINHGIKFDTIIVDICMPYMSGVELAQQIKQRELKGHRHIPLLALSSIDLQVKGGIEHFDAYFNKPIDQNTLYPLLYKCLAARDDSETSDSVGDSPTTAPQSKKCGANENRRRKPKKDIHILIAEDDHTNSYTIKEMLKYEGFDHKKIEVVENGERCVAAAKKRDFDVILMDIVMPVMDGIEAIKHIRVMKNRPYIIAVSAAVQNSDKQRCHQIGVDGYLTKPVVRDELKAVLSPLIL